MEVSLIILNLVLIGFCIYLFLQIKKNKKLGVDVMAKKVSELTAITSLDSNDLLYAVDTSATASKKITLSDVSKSIGSTATTATEIDGLDTLNVNDKDDGSVKKINLNNFWISIKKNSGDLPSGWNRIDPSYYTSTPVFEYYNGATFVTPDTWQSGYSYSLGNVVGDGSGNLYMEECVGAGTSGGTIPGFFPIEGMDVSDSGVTWCTRGYTVIETTIDFSNDLHIYKGTPVIVEHQEGSTTYRYPMLLKIVGTNRIALSGNAMNLQSGTGGPINITNIWAGDPNMCKQFNFDFDGNWNSDAADIELLDKYGRAFRWNLTPSYVVELSVRTKTEDTTYNNFINMLSGATYATSEVVSVNRDHYGIQPEASWIDNPYSSFHLGFAAIEKGSSIYFKKFHNASCTRNAQDLSISFTAIPIYGFYWS